MFAKTAAVIVFSLLVQSEPIAANAAVSTTERSELISLYSSTHGNTWTNNTNWCAGTCPSTGKPVFNAPGTECTWYGVKCDSSETQVLDIHLSKNHLTGQLPKFAGFTDLQYFDGSVNQLTGNIPDLTGLTNLQVFSVHDNHLTGEFPELANIVRARPRSDTTDATAAAQTPAEQEESADKAAALAAALAATGNDYPVPAVFVKRWNLLAKALPDAQIATFTSRGRENDPRPIADLAGFDFNSAGSTYLRLGASSISIEYVNSRDDPINIGAKERPNAYSITVKGHQKNVFGQFCLWAIRSTRSSFTLHSAIQLFGDAAHNKPPTNATDLQKHAEAEGVRLTLRNDGENSICEVKEASNE